MITDCGEHGPLGDEYVDHVARTDFIACLSRFKSRLGRNDRLGTGSGARDVTFHVDVLRACQLGHVALGLFDALRRTVVLGIRLSAAGTDHPARIQRHGEGQGNGVRVVVPLEDARGVADQVELVDVGVRGRA